MAEIDFNYDVLGAIEDALAQSGYPRYRLDREASLVLDVFFDILADDLVDGESDWPVATGYSQASFYACGAALCNHAPYAPYVEGNTGAVEDYVSGNIDDLIERAIEFSGIPAARPQQRRGLFDRPARLEDNVRSRFENAVIGRFRGLGRTAALFRRRGNN